MKFEDFNQTDFTAGNVKGLMAQVAEGRLDMNRVRINEIRVMDGFNPRSDTPAYREHVRNLAAIMAVEGYYPDKPLAGIVLRDSNGDDHFYVTDGHTRLDAAKLANSEMGANIDLIPVVVKPRGTTMEDLTFAVFQTSEGSKKLEPYEQGVLIKRLINMGHDEKAIAKRINKTPTYVKMLLDLVSAPAAVRQMVMTGQVSASLAVETLRKSGPDAVKVLKESMVEAQAAGKTKVTAKSVKKVKAKDKPTPLKLKGVIPRAVTVGATSITIKLDSPLDVDLFKDDMVRLVIRPNDDL